MRIQNVIRRPLITEKATTAREERNEIAFEVDGRANKLLIKRAVESRFAGVKVAQVRIANQHGKVRRQGRFAGRRPDWKKAYVKLAQGQIDFFEGA